MSRLSALESREALDLEAAAERLSLARAVDICDDDLRAGGKLVGERVPIGLHGLAVASPGERGRRESASNTVWRERGVGRGEEAPYQGARNLTKAALPELKTTSSKLSGVSSIAACATPSTPRSNEVVLIGTRESRGETRGVRGVRFGGVSVARVAFAGRRLSASYSGAPGNLRQPSTSAHQRMRGCSMQVRDQIHPRSFGLALSAISLLKKEGGAEVPLTRSRRQALPSTWAAAVHRRQRTNLSPAMHA